MVSGDEREGMRGLPFARERRETLALRLPGSPVSGPPLAAR